MPAVRHGRSGKARRPRLEESPLADVAEDTLAHPAMRKLAAEAARRGLSARDLGSLVNRAPESLMRSLYADSPRLATVESICDAMRFGKRVARALLGVLTDRDERDLRVEVGLELLRRQALFVNFHSLETALSDELATVSQAKRRDALAAFEIARNGLSDDAALQSEALVPGLRALCAALKFDFMPYVVLEAIFETKVLEAAAALVWFLDSLPLSKRDSATLQEVAKRYSIKSTRLVFRGALARAKDEFRRALGDEPR